MIMKNIFKTVICVLICASISLSGSFESGDLTYAKQKTFTRSGIVYAVVTKPEHGDWGSVSVVGVDENAEPGQLFEICLPSTVKNGKSVYRVRSVEPLAFSCRSGIHRVIIQDEMEEIGSAAFYKCTDLEEIFLPAGVSKIGSHCFGGCPSLVSIAVSNMNGSFVSDGTVLYSKDGKTLISAPGVCGEYGVKNGVETIGAGAFDSNTSITGIKLPGSVKTIEESAFYGCISLKSIDLCNTESIGSEAFAGSGLTSITIPASTKKIKGNPFVFCNKLTSVKVSKKNTSFKSSGGLLLNSSGKTVISGNACVDGFVFPSGVKSINSLAFAGNERIGSIVIPKSIKNIGEGAFSYCTGLGKVRFLSRKTKLFVPDDDSFGIFFNTNYDLIIEVPYSETGFEKDSFEEHILLNGPEGLIITTY